MLSFSLYQSTCRKKSSEKLSASKRDLAKNVPVSSKYVVSFNSCLIHSAASLIIIFKSSAKKQRTDEGKSPTAIGIGETLLMSHRTEVKQDTLLTKTKNKNQAATAGAYLIFGSVHISRFVNLYKYSNIHEMKYQFWLIHLSHFFLFPHAFFLMVNCLVVCVPSEMSKLQSLVGLHMYTNELTGSIPNTLRNLSSLSGEIPHEMGISRDSHIWTYQTTPLLDPYLQK
ncbi:hypothetical protein EJ110_NYTH34492 [Nymphaea thermarum]|nr:hypothetical protein EJ110_NYTH34492 [Nymphaea thermarum]